MRAWYRSNVKNRIDGVAEHEKFCDYWRGVAGAKGIKTDWIATWRNWMRRADEQSPGFSPTRTAVRPRRDKNAEMQAVLNELQARKGLPSGTP
jgi:hypothetical protein